MQAGNRAEKLSNRELYTNERNERKDRKGSGMERRTEAKIIPLRKIEEEDIPVRRAGRTPRQKQENGRFIVAAALTVCVVFMMGWCVIQTIRNINDGTQVINLNAPNQVVEENKKGDGKSMDTDQLAKKILDHVAFDVELEKFDDSIAEGMISTADGTRLQIYMGNGTSADELVIMTALNEKDAEKNQEYVKAHLAEKKKQFALYIPEQAKKIENAIEVRSGCYVIVCITSDTETAKKTIDTFLQQ